LELHMLAHDRIVLLVGELLGLGAGVLLGDVIEASISHRHELDLDGSGFSNWSVLVKAKTPRNTMRRNLGANYGFAASCQAGSVDLTGAEAIHTVGPLQADNAALDGWQDGQRHDDGQRQHGIEID